MKHYKQMAKDNSKFIIYMKHYKLVTKDIIHMYYYSLQKDSKIIWHVKP